MPRITWDDIGERLYETGVSHGVLYPFSGSAYENGVAWNGLTAVNQKPSGAEPKPLYANNHKYANLMSSEEFSATLEAYTYPDEFAACDGSAELVKGVNISQQNRKTFGLCYRTEIGNDSDGQDHGYKIHLIYGCLAAPSERGYKTVGDSPEAINMSWTMTTTPVAVEGFKPTAHLEISSLTTDAEKLAEFEGILYGDSAGPRMPLPNEIKTLLAPGA